MAKGRKHDSDRRERLLGPIGYGQGERAAGADLSDLREEDVWPISASEDAVGGDDAWCAADDRHGGGRAPRWHAGDDRHVGGLSLAFDDGGYRTSPTVLHQYRRNAGVPAVASAPVNVPDWTRILRVDSAETLQGSVEPEGDDGEWLPPHEYLAREHGKTVATSVFEGVGRTLKGRDMSRVRDAVWSQTGFFG